MIIIKQITSTETFPVRQPVLRPGKPLHSCIFEGDDLPTTIHLGIYDDEILMGVLSIFEAVNYHFTEELQYQLRGMAILETHQRKGLGEQLVQEAEKIATEKKVELIWFNARETAVRFYQKMNYQIIGNSFSVGDLGLHYVMFKKLS